MSDNVRMLKERRTDQAEVEARMEKLAKRGSGDDSGGMPPDDILPRVAVLEQIAKDTSETLRDIRAEMKGIRSDMKDMRAELRAEIKATSDRQERDFRLSIAWTFIMASTLLGVMAKGFGWV